MADFGRSPWTDAVGVIQGCIDENEQSAADLENRAALAVVDANKWVAKAAEFRAANKTLRAQIALLKVEEIA